MDKVEGKVAHDAWPLKYLDDGGQCNYRQDPMYQEKRYLITNNKVVLTCDTAICDFKDRVYTAAFRIANRLNINQTLHQKQSEKGGQWSKLSLCVPGLLFAMLFRFPHTRTIYHSWRLIQLESHLW